MIQNLMRDLAKGPITSSSGFAEAIQAKFYETSSTPACLTGPEYVAKVAIQRITATAIRDRLSQAIRLRATPDFTGDDFFRHFTSQILYIWRCLLTSPAKESVDYRVSFRHWMGRKPASVTAVQGDEYRVEDAEMLCRIIEWAAGPGKLAATFRAQIFAEDFVLRNRFSDFALLVYPQMRHAVVAAGLNDKIYYAGFARLHVKQGGPNGTDVGLKFHWRRQLQWPLAPEKASLSKNEIPKGFRGKFMSWWRRLQWPLVPMKQIIFVGDAADLEARNFQIYRMTASCTQALQLIDAFIDKYGVFVPVDLDTLDYERLGTIGHSGGVTQNPKARERDL
ncbi:hypothetical protein HY971_00975 [Candidatus Kaiserbacteria bacterium]|nr:hypothetical protein [Candidatus Kaiserbacteria bacterium]